MQVDFGLTNGLLLGIAQETIYIMGLDDEGNDTGEVGEGSAIHIHLLLFRLSLIFD